LRDHTQPGTLPLRPLTTGELLDAAVVVLRTRTGHLIWLGFILAAAEQALLFPLRRLAEVDSSFLPGEDRLAAFGVLVMVGFATEAFCIAVLGGTAATEAPRALLGPGTPPRPLRPVALAIAAVAAAALCAVPAVGFLVFPLPLQVAGLMLATLIVVVVWPFPYGLAGLAGPAVVVDQLNPMRAIARSFRLAGRGAMRTAWIRVLGYTVWLLVRLGLGIATMAVVQVVYSSPSPTVDNLIMGGAWLIVNALAYPVLGCLDVALHLEARMRSEGLDIALRRTFARGVSADTALAVPRPVAGV
jgi:hypothetical protein